MYDMYPDWCPARLNDDQTANPRNSPTPVQESLDRRDNGGEWPVDD